MLRKPILRNPKSEIRNPKSEIRNPKSEIRIPNSEIRIPNSGVPTPILRNPKLRANRPDRRTDPSGGQGDDQERAGTGEIGEPRTRLDEKAAGGACAP
jgi:hypothetical protein